MKFPALVPLDIAAPVRRPNAVGALLLVFGLISCGAVGYAFNSKMIERDRLEARLSAVARPLRMEPRTSPGDAAAAAAVQRELSTPWIRLLAELEAASLDRSSTIALLQVQPDPAKHIVRITAEARTLPDALAYLERLQKSDVLRYPMLESHELRKDDAEHPIRVKLTAEWRT
jgi:hypothetical protein